MSTSTATKTAAVKDAGVKKPGQSKGRKGNKARTAMIKMQAFFKEHRDEYKDLDFKEQQKELGKLWKASSENPKNKAEST